MAEPDRRAPGTRRGWGVTRTAARSAGTITALVPYFGGKMTLAAEIVRQLGPHRAYWEPFCGSMAVLLAKPPSSMETVNDLYADLINLARVLQRRDQAKELLDLCRWTLFHEGLHEQAKSDLEEPLTPGVARAHAFLVASWFGRNGVTGTEAYNNNFCVRFTVSGGSPAVRWAGVVRSIRAWSLRLSRVTILQRDAFGLLERIEDAPGTAIYCDPPYLEKGASYIHDFKANAAGGLMFADDHDRLAVALGRFRMARVVVSYYPHERLDAMYPPDRWNRVEVNMSKATAHQVRRGESDSRATEVLLINGPVVETQEGTQR